MAEIFFISIYCVGAWKAGWTKAPASESIFKVVGRSYEVGEEDDESIDEKESITAMGCEEDSEDGKDSKDEETTAMTASGIGSP